MAQQKEQLGLKELVAMGVGGMVGGGIFSVLGLSVALSGHAAPIAFGLGGIIALLTGFSYARLGISFRSDGGSFTYLEHAFAHRNISGIGGTNKGYPLYKPDCYYGTIPYFCQYNRSDYYLILCQLHVSVDFSHIKSLL